jgi:G3E family GTPase
MSEIKTVPITLITGYLGSGKTTLVNHILRNTKNHKMAVIVNDLGEVNIDAELISKEGIVSGKDDNLVALQNGCICCTLKKDLIEQLADLVQSQKFDHIIIEASGICEPVPIAQTISYMEEEFNRQNLPKFYKLDAIVSVVDVLRLRDEFGCGEVFKETKRGEEDLENLVIQQIEFCDVIVLNKVSDITPTELKRVEAVIKAIQPKAKIVHTDYCKVDIDEIVDTNLFSFEKAATSAAWISEFENWDNEIDSDEAHEHHHDDDDDDDDDDKHEHHHEHEHEEHEHEEHGHHHHHHHEHGVGENDDEGTADEYDVNTFVYYRRRPFEKEKFIEWAKNNGRKIIRSKGILYFKEEEKLVYVYEQVGKQCALNNTGKWYSVILSKKQIEQLIKEDKNFAHDWDPKYGDKLIKLVFIGQHLDKEGIVKELDQI